VRVLVFARSGAAATPPSGGRGKLVFEDMIAKMRWRLD